MVEAGIGEDAADETHRERLIGRHEPASGQEIERLSLTDGPAQDRHDHCRHEADVDFRVAELCLFMCKNQVTRGCEPSPPCKRASAHDGDDWLGERPDNDKHASERFGVPLVSLGPLVEHRLQRLQIGAGTEVWPLRPELHDTNIVVSAEVLERAP